MSTATSAAAGEPVRPAPRSLTWSQSLGGRPVFVIAGAAFVAGFVWLPLWFLAAELLRLWAPRGGMRWLASRGVPEYTDDNIAAAIGIVPVFVIAARIALALDWIAPLQIFNGKSADVSPGEWAALLDLSLGLAIATSLAGVLRTTGWPRAVAIAGFVGVTVAAVAGQLGLGWRPNAFQALPLIVLAYLVAAIAIRTDRWLYRRAARRLGSPQIADSGKWERP
jgi:hypothetical protein